MSILSRVEIPVFSESWRTNRHLAKATYAILVKPELNSLSKFNKNGGTKWTEDRSDGQLVFLYSLRIYQNYVIDSLREKATGSKSKVTEEWAIQQAKEFGVKTPYINFTGTDEYIDLFTKYIGGDSGRALIMHAFGGNCYFDIHSQETQASNIQMPVAV